MAAAARGGATPGPRRCGGADRWGRELQRCPFRVEFDAVIVAAGWRFSTGLFEAPLAEGVAGASKKGRKAVVPELHANGKHPATRGGGFESANVPGLFFAGAAMHGNDYKARGKCGMAISQLSRGSSPLPCRALQVSSGGFIHGFRHLCRALHRQLEEAEADDQAAAAVAAAARQKEAEKQGGDNASAAAAAAAAAAVAPDGGVVAGSSAAATVATGLASAGALIPPADWPRTPLTCGLRGLVAAVMRRLNVAAGIFQACVGRCCCRRRLPTPC